MSGSGFINPAAGQLQRSLRLFEIFSDGIAAQAAARTNLGLSALPIVGSNAFRNRILNGDFRIDQANVGAAVVVNGVAGPSQFSGPDKWRGSGTAAAGVFSLQQLAATPPAGFTNYLRATVTTADAAPVAGSNYSFLQNIEGIYCQDLQFGLVLNVQFITLSFQLRCSVAGNFSGSIRNSALNRSYPFIFATGPAANTWVAVNIQIPIDTLGAWLVNNSVGISLSFDLGSGANSIGGPGAWNGNNNTGSTGVTSLMATNGATLDLTGVQMEAGAVATLFEQCPFPEMLRLCQREFFKTFLQATAPMQNAGANTGEIQFTASRLAALVDSIFSSFPVLMRAVPVMVGFNPQSANAQVRDFDAAADCSTTGFNMTERGVKVFTTGNVSTTAGNVLALHYTADARL